jgi:hypothetical protein
MKSRLIFSCCLALIVCLPIPAIGQSPTSGLVLEGGEGLGTGQHIVFVTGEEYYRSEEGMSMFAKIMSRHHGFKCTVLFATDPATGYINPNQVGSIPGLAVLKNADLMVIFARFRELSDADMKHIADYVDAGKPVFGIRNATHAFRYSATSTSPYKDWSFRSKEWPGGFGQQILGDTWVAHYGKFQKESTRADVNPKHRKHPVLRGVGDTIFVHTDVNSVVRLKPDDLVLFNGRVLSGLNPTDPLVTDKRKGVRMPWAWFRNYTAPSGKKGRSFTTTAGASLDFLNEDLRRLMVNAMLLLTGHEKEIPEKTNVDFVDPYLPRPTGSHSDAEWGKAKLSAKSYASPFGFVSLFNGRDLTGWEGDPKLWKVEGGIVIGTCDGPDSLKHNSFLVWNGGKVKDFELRATLRVIGDNNSGIQYRSRELPEVGPWVISGYQCDVHPAIEHTGMTYEEKGRGIFGLNGRNVMLDREGGRWLLSEHDPVKVDISQWNEFTVIARGNHLIHKVNGQVTSEMIDHHEQGRALSGLLAIQLHRGNPNRVQIKDVRIKTFTDGELLPFNPSKLPEGAQKIDRPRTNRPQGTGPVRPPAKKK